MWPAEISPERRTSEPARHDLDHQPRRAQFHRHGSGPVGSNFYSGSLTGTGGLTGSFQGRFYGPGAPETGGQFDFAGTNYVGSGIFIGRR